MDYLSKWMPDIGSGTQAFGVGYATMAAYNRGQMQKNLMGYEADVARNNATMAGYQADVAQHVGEQQEQNSRLRTGQIMGSQRAVLGASGVDMGQGSASEVLATTDYMGERDAMTIRQNTANEVWALNNEKRNFMAESEAARDSASAINPTMSAIGTFATGATMFARQWYPRS